MIGPHPKQWKLPYNPDSGSRLSRSWKYKTRPCRPNITNRLLTIMPPLVNTRYILLVLDISFAINGKTFFWINIKKRSLKNIISKFLICHQKAEQYYVEAGSTREAVDMYNNAGKWEMAHKVNVPCTGIKAFGCNSYYRWSSSFWVSSHSILLLYFVSLKSWHLHTWNLMMYPHCTYHKLVN